MKELSRIGIFLFRDEYGVVDDYISFLLNDISQNLNELYIVVNGVLNDEGYNTLKQFSEEIIIRPDIGFDVGGWQDVILNYCGFEKISTYDELILFNDSFFGPLYPFADVFQEMDEKDVDFWGLSSHGAAPGIGNCVYGDRPRYLQTYFLAFRKNLTQSPVFQYFWAGMPTFETFEAVGEGFGCYFTKKFEDLGYRWCAFSDTSDLESEDIRKNMSFHTFNPYDMVVNRKLPIIKRKAFVTEKSTVLRFNYGDELRKLLNHVKQNTDYDIQMIYKYLIRVYNLYDLKNSLNLNYILPTCISYNSSLKNTKKIAVIAHLYYPELFEYCLNYLSNVPDNIDIILTIGSEEKKSQLLQLAKNKLNREIDIRLVDQRGRDLSALLVGCKDILSNYEYLCFIHDKRSVQKEYITVGISFCDLLWENMLKSKSYIENILNLFEENPQIGLLVPPNVYHGSYYWSSVNYWTICYDKTKQLATSLDLQSKIEKEKPPISVGTVFWCKSRALKNLFDFPFEYKDFPAEPLPNDGSINHVIERIIPYVAQHHGYLTGCVMNTEYAEAEITNYRYMLSDVQKALRGMPAVKFNTHKTMINSINASKREHILLSKNMPVREEPKEKIVYVTKEQPVEIITEAPVQQTEQIGLKGALIIYMENKKWPSFIIKFMRKLVKYNENPGETRYE